MPDQSSGADPANEPGAAPASPPPELASTCRPADRYGFVTRGGSRLRYACWNASGTGSGFGSRGSVVLLQGRAEFIEKYAVEIVPELVARGFAVFALDIRGQGLSDRPLPDRNKGHIDDFTTYVEDLQAFLEEVVAPAAPRPVLALSHSTSGNILLRYLVAHGSGPLAGALFVSPMTGLWREGLIRVLVNVLSPFGLRDRAYMAATGPYDRAHRNFASNDVTNDERRYRFTDQWFAADPRLILGGPTFGWLRQAVRSIDALKAPGALERIDLPVTLVTTPEDKVVDPQSHREIVARIKGASLTLVEGAKHEILMETDPRLAQFWAAFDRFVASLPR